MKQDIQSKQKQYRLHHWVKITIHAYQGETFVSMATEVSQHDSNFSLRHEDQFVFILIQTKLSNETIFVDIRLDKLMF